MENLLASSTPEQLLQLCGPNSQAPPPTCPTTSQLASADGLRSLPSLEDCKRCFNGLSGTQERIKWIQDMYCVPGIWSTGEQAQPQWLSTKHVFSYTNDIPELTQRPVHAEAIDSIAQDMKINGVWLRQWFGINQDAFVIQSAHPGGRCECCDFWGDQHTRPRPRVSVMMCDTMCV